MAIGKLNSAPRTKNHLTQLVEEQRLLRFQERLREKQTSLDINSQVSATLTLSAEALKRAELLKKYPKLEGKVQITNEKIIVTTEAGELTFGFSHTEGGQTFQNAQKPYSKEQLGALVQVFGSKSGPYLDILGMKNTHTDNGRNYNWNFYWSSSEHANLDLHAWGLLLFEFDVDVGYGNRGNSYSAIVSQNF